VSGLVVRDLTAGYDGVGVLRDVDLDVADGALACLVGPSGSGKSTLLRCVAGLHPVETGTITLAGTRVEGLRPERRGIGLVPQDAALFTHLTVERNVGYGLFRLTRSERRSRVAELLELTGLAALGRRMPDELSGGEQQRVALARALAPRPALVLLDEPFSGLDPQLRADLRDQVRTVLAELAVPALLVSHDRDEAMSLGRQVVVIRAGRIRQSGSPDDLYRRPADPWTGRYVGDAVVLAGVADGAVVRCSLGMLRSASRHVGPVTVLLRPEQVRLARDRDGPAVTVRSIAYRGRDWQVQADTATGESLKAWWADDPDADRTAVPEVGERLRVEVVGPVLVFDRELGPGD
jgi:iron(III) transport system ATP-binding protein